MARVCRSGLRSIRPATRLWNLATPSLRARSPPLRTLSSSRTTIDPGRRIQMIRRMHIAVFSTAPLVAVSFAALYAQQRPVPALTIGTTDIGGVVTSASGPEAGVWVIAETMDLPTKFAKVVVTDQQGRYLIPEL